MNPRFLKGYFYTLLSLTIVVLILSFIFDLEHLYRLYLSITYPRYTVPIILAIGLPAVLCLVSFVITKLCVREAGHSPMRFSWINTVLFLLFLLLSAFVLWQTPKSGTFLDYLHSCYSDVILFGIFSLIFISLISVASYAIRQTKTQAVETRISSSWYTVFFILTLMLSAAYVLLGILQVDRGINFSKIFSGLIFLLAAVFAVSFLVAILSVGGGVLLGKNRPLAFILGIIVGVIFFSSQIFMCIVVRYDLSEYMSLGVK